MCGIWVYLLKQGQVPTISNGEIYDSFMKVYERGPEVSTIIKQSKFGLYIGFHRLSIMDPTTNGDQPFILECPDEDKVIYAVCNGEIYNFMNLCIKYNLDCKSGSDCELLPHLYKQIGIDQMVNELIGEFSFCICEISRSTGEVKCCIARDQAGIRPLFVTQSENEMLFSSELKGSPFLNKDFNVNQFKPRHYATVSNIDLELQYTEYLNFNKITPHINSYDQATQLIQDTFIKCVECRMISDRPIGCLLSGGLDSSLVSAIAARYCERHGTQLQTFSIGMDGSTDKHYAELVSKHINSKHTHIELPEQDWLDAIEHIPQIIESYDTTTVRASTGQYLISKWISENTDIKVLLIGDGSDELCAGYLYNHKCTNSEDLHKDGLRLINDIHFFDVLRADRGIASNGLEARVPFLDTRFISLYFSINPNLRIPTNNMEKWLLRESFKLGDFLPHEVLYRRKEAFSDAVSSVRRSWYSIIQEHIESLYSNDEFRELKQTYTHCIPASKESLYFRKLFEKHFGIGKNTEKVIPYYWLPKWVDPNISEPSARVLDVYNT